MLAPLLAFIVYIVYTVGALYIQFIRNNCYDMIENFKKICQLHIHSDRANHLFTPLEIESLSKEIIKSGNQYKNSIVGNQAWSEEDDTENMKKLFKIADDLNYITIQTSAHNLEFIVVYLIIQRTKLRNINKYFDNKSLDKAKKINQILFIICLSEATIYQAIVSFLTTILILKVFYNQNQ